VILASARDPARRAVIAARKARSTFWAGVALAATATAVIIMAVILYTVLDSTFGFVAVANTVEPADLVTGRDSLAEMTRTELLGTIEDRLSRGIVRRLESEVPLAQRSDDDLREVLQENLIKPEILETWTLTDSVFRRAEISAYLEANPGTRLVFRSWINAKFLTSHQSRVPEQSGIRAGVFGSMYIILIALVFSFPLGILAATYLQEYARPGLLTRVIEVNIQNLSSIPSVIYGLLGLTFFARYLSPITSGNVFGIDSTNGRTLLSAGLTLGLLVLPLVIINTQEAYRSIPATYRNACVAIGAPRWKTVSRRYLPYIVDRILTTVVLAISRIIGEIAPLIILGASTFIAVDPEGIFSKFTALPVEIFFWSSRPQTGFRNLAAAAILVLVVLTFTLNMFVIFFRDRFRESKVV
jgi:phosphate transport system permease protein